MSACPSSCVHRSLSASAPACAHACATAYVHACLSACAPRSSRRPSAVSAELCCRRGEGIQPGCKAGRRLQRRRRMLALPRER
eukprot:363643-Chlamydomonas_euryale.AAC.2